MWEYFIRFMRAIIDLFICPHVREKHDVYESPQLFPLGVHGVIRCGVLSLPLCNFSSEFE